MLKNKEKMIKYIQKTKGFNLEKICKKHGIKKENVVYCGKGTKWENMINMDYYKNSGKTTKLRKIQHYLLHINISASKIITELRGKILMGDDSLKKFNEGLSHCSVLWDYVNEFTKDKKASDYKAKY